MRIGFDIGGVIIDRANDGTDTAFFGPNYLQTTPVPGAFESIARIVTVVGRQNVHIVSKASQRTAAKTLEWLFAHDFFQITGLTIDSVNFCRMRVEKAPICAKLGLTHFVDDKLEVLSYLTTVPNRYLFQGEEREIARWGAHLPYVQRVQSWAELEELL